MANNNLFTAYPKKFDTGNVAVPTGNTAITSVDSEIFEIQAANPTGGAITFSVTDTAGNAIVPTVSIGANTVFLAIYNNVGLEASGGVKWQAGSSGLIGKVKGRQHANLSTTNGIA